METQYNLTLLKNIDQKLKISKQNQYMRKDAKSDLSIVIVSQMPNKRNKIVSVNRQTLDLLKYKPSELIKKDMKMLIPVTIAIVHDQIIDDFLEGENTNKDANLRRVWVKNSDGNIVPVQISVQTCISQDKGLYLVAFLERLTMFKTKNFQARCSDAYFLVTDEYGVIVNCSQNFSDDFLNGNAFLEDSRINIDEIFQGI